MADVVEVLQREIDKLKPAGAHIVHFKGEGYRLQNIEGDA